MKLSHLSTASALALVLALGLPAHAQVTTDQQVDEPAAATTPPETETAAAGQVADTRMGLGELHDQLGELGIEDRENFGGRVIVAERAGDPVILLLGPENFEHDTIVEFDLEEFGELRDQLADAGFENARQDDAWALIQGTLDDYYVLAASGHPDWGTEAGRMPGTAMDFDGDDFEERLGEAGIEDRTEFTGKLVQATTEQGYTITMLVGPEGFEGDAEIDLSEDDLRDRLQEAGLGSIRIVEDNIYMYRGSYGDKSVLALGGALATDPMPTGAVQPERPETDVEVDIDEDEIEAID